MLCAGGQRQGCAFRYQEACIHACIQAFPSLQLKTYVHMAAVLAAVDAGAACLKREQRCDMLTAASMLLTSSVISAYAVACGRQQHNMLGSWHSACLCFNSASSTLQDKTQQSTAQHVAIQLRSCCASNPSSKQNLATGRVQSATVMPPLLHLYYSHFSTLLLLLLLVVVKLLVCMEVFVLLTLLPPLVEW